MTGIPVSETRTSSLAGPTDEAALRAQTRLVHEWRRFPFLDPRLPAQLLPDSWSGAKAADLFHTRHADCLGYVPPRALIDMR